MKLKTKLIPLAGALVVCSSLTPLSLVSCNDGQIINKAVNLIDNYYPVIERSQPIEGEEMKTPHELNEIYSEQLKQRKDTFVQDYMWSKSWTGVAFEQFLFWLQLVSDNFLKTTNSTINDYGDRDVLGPVKDYYKKDIEVISDLSIDFQDVMWGAGQTWTIPMMSFTLHFDSDIHPIILEGPIFDEQKVDGSINGKISGEISFYNVPFYITDRVVYSIDTGLTSTVISFEPFYEWMIGEHAPTPPNWIIKTVVVSSMSGDIQYATGAEERIADDWVLNVTSDTNHPEWVYDTLSLSQTIGCVFTTSYFLEKYQIRNI